MDPKKRPYTLIANSGIQMFVASIEVDSSQIPDLWVHEWYEEGSDVWQCELVHKVVFEDDDNEYYYPKIPLIENGFFAKGYEITQEDLLEYKMKPVEDNNRGDSPNDYVYKVSTINLDSFENQWIPFPYFMKNGKFFTFGPTNWSRCKLIPKRTKSKGIKEYDVIFAFDTRSLPQHNDYYEYPVFPSAVDKELVFGVCGSERELMSMFDPNSPWTFINDTLFKLCYPELRRPSQLPRKSYKFEYITNYIGFILLLANSSQLTDVILYRGDKVQTKNVDMVVDIGNSRTTALLIEDKDLNHIKKLQLIDFTNPYVIDEGIAKIQTYKEPFDMRLAFRKVDFGDIGLLHSPQFVYPSLVRLGREASWLINNSRWGEIKTLCSHSSPKRYLWDTSQSEEEWRNLTLDGEESTGILDCPWVTDQLSRDGRRTKVPFVGGGEYYYSRRSLMTFSFLEMLSQAQIQINSDSYRRETEDADLPRRIVRLIVTCPTAMSKTEREELTKCAKEAAQILEHLNVPDDIDKKAWQSCGIEIVPTVVRPDDESKWYFDEATCSQLVYVYGELGHKYKGNSEVFFNLYGKKRHGSQQATLTIGSLDIGAGTSDLMISEYSYSNENNITTITPSPIFYDSYYYAGDDIVEALIKNVMFLDASSPLREKHSLQTMRDFFGQDYGGITFQRKTFRKQFNIQYAIPLMYHFLELLNNNSTDKMVTFDDAFPEIKPSHQVSQYFEEHFGQPLESLTWYYRRDQVYRIVFKEFEEKILRHIAVIMHACSCDIILLSGRPASLPPVRDVFLKYFPVTPDRLILLNNYYIGRYPFDNNTGYIADPKTIVAVGAIYGYYATKLHNLGNFVIDLEKLDANLHSTVNYIENRRVNSGTIDYVFTEGQTQGEIVVTELPRILNVRQLGEESYPNRPLYAIDYNRAKIASRVLNKFNPDTDSHKQQLVDEEIDKLQQRLNFTIKLRRDVNDKEQIEIESIQDRNGEEVNINDIHIHIQSQGGHGDSWLDTGAFSLN